MEELSKTKKHLFQAITLLLLILSLVSVALFFLAVQWVKIANGVDRDRNVITVSGRGEVVAVPDVAEISFAVVEEAGSAADAQELATDKINKIVNLLEESGLEEEDMKTTSYNVNPKYEYFYENSAGLRCASSYCPPPYYRKQVISGYEVSQWVQIKIRDIDSAGEVLAGITEFDVSNVSGLNFTIDDEEELKTEARELAIKDAREEAKRLAKELGVRLGDIVSFNESGNYPYPMYDYARSDSMMMEIEESFAVGGGKLAAPAIPSGENEVVANVTITYEIK